MNSKGIRILSKKYSRKVVEPEPIWVHKSHICEACKCDCQEDQTRTGKCDFSVIPREEMVKKYFIYTKVVIPMEFQEDVDEVFNIGTYYYGELLPSVYLMDVTYDVCDMCQGTGVIINPNSIDQCDTCNGTGLIEKEHGDEVAMEFNTTWEGYEYKYRPGDPQSICSDYIKRCNNENLSIGYVKKKYLTYRGKIPVLDENRIYVLLNKDMYKVEAIGDYFDIHKNVGIPLYMDIEYVSGGLYEVKEYDEFWDSNLIVPRKSVVLTQKRYDDMQRDIMWKNIWMYSRYATYDCTELIDSYLETYHTTDMIRDNIYYHCNSQYIDQLVPIPEDKASYLDKIIKDGELFGMELDRADAAAIIHLTVMLIGKEHDVLLLHHNAVAVFIVEYICISAEYDELSNK